jgi:hypothetical protein
VLLQKNLYHFHRKAKIIENCNKFCEIKFQDLFPFAKFTQKSRFMLKEVFSRKLNVMKGNFSEIC